jgi:membrane protease YdiL (CAAX protease family)
MQSLLKLISQTDSPQLPAAEPLAGPFWDPASIILLMAGCSILVVWACWFGGPRALRHAPVRRHHRLLPAWSLLILIIWISSISLIQTIISLLFESQSESLQEILIYPLNTLLELGLIGVMLLAANRLFARRLKGFGLNTRHIFRQAGLAVLSLLAVFPIILLSLWITQIAGKIFKGPDFAVQVHDSLSILSDSGPGLQILIVLFAVLIVPVFEELLFRGFFQTSLRTLSGKTWVGIMLTSVFFAILHPPTHILALFALSCGLGYAYERHGSLLRPILMHILFNGLSVVMTLLMPH